MNVGAVNTVGSLRSERIVNNFARVTQFLTWPFLFVIFHILFRIRISGREHFDAMETPFLIIANHVSFYDSFFFRLVLGWNTPHLPLRFMAVTHFNWPFLNFLSAAGIIDFIYSLFGVFTVTPGLGIAANLERARHVIEAGGNVVIYPEGKIATGNGIGEFKKGAAVLAIQTRVPVVPVSFRIRTSRWQRPVMSIHVGESIMSVGRNDAEQFTVMLHDAELALYEAE